MSKRITPEAYKIAQERVIACAVLAEQIDIEGMIDAMGRAEALGPIVDPTLWQQGHGNMEKLKRLAELLLPVKREMQRQRSGG